MTENTKKKVITVSTKKLVLSAYLYMVIPIVIFFIGWLKPYLGIGCSVILLYGLHHFIKKRYREDEYFYIESKSLLIIIFAIVAWVFLSGMGGYFYQRGDWHWRNATFRDLINYSWPVIYPETGNAMVYYYAFWMVPALVGKIMGWGAANFALYVWTCTGILISMLLMCKALKANTPKKVSIMVFLYIFWSGLNIFGILFSGIMGHNSSIIGGGYGWSDFSTGYQFTPNNALLEWVFNQTIVPWVAIPLFLQDKRIDVLAYLGLCVLPFAPFPFVGLFVLTAAWAASEIVCNVRQNACRTILKQIFSIPNLTSVATVFVVFLLFFKENTAANGSSGAGGIGWYIAPWEMTSEQLLVLVLFYIFEFFAYSVLIYKENHNNLFFYVCNTWLFICPFIRVGTGRDFCMRASVPALFMLMCMVVEYFYKEKGNLMRTVMIISVITLSSLSTVSDWGEALYHFRAEGRYPICADDFITFSNDNAVDNLNFVVETPNHTVFYKYLAKVKSAGKKEKDLEIARNYRMKYKIPISSGNYVVNPKQDSSVCISSDGMGTFLKKDSAIVMITSMKNGECRFLFNEYGVALDVPGCVVDDSGTIWVWQLLMDSPGQRFTLEQVGEYYMICYHEFALTYNLHNNSLKLLEKTGNENQLWSFSPVKL